MGAPGFNYVCLGFRGVDSRAGGPLVTPGRESVKRADKIGLVI